MNEAQKDRDENKTNIELNLENKAYTIEWDGSQFVVTVNTTLKNSIRTDRKYYNWITPMLKALSTELIAGRKTETLKELYDTAVDTISIMDDIMRMIEIRFQPILLTIGADNEK